MSQSQNSNNAVTAKSPDMLRRQEWNTDDILCMGNEDTYADAAKEIIPLWNEWADSVETILHGMINQMEELDISYDDYLTSVRQLASYPARPALPTAESQDKSDRPLNDIWNEWADIVESILEHMKRTVDQGHPLPREEQILCAGVPIEFSLDLSNQDPPPMHMAAHLRKMLQDATVARDELAGFMEILSLW